MRGVQLLDDARLRRPAGPTARRSCLVERRPDVAEVRELVGLRARLRLRERGLELGRDLGVDRLGVVDRRREPGDRVAPA